MKDDPIRLLVLVLATWGAAVAEASHDGVFAKLSEPEAAALALFAFAFAPACYFLDRSLRELALSPRSLAIAVVAVDAALVLAWFAMRDMAVYFVGPVALAVQAAAIDRALSAAARVRKAPARSPASSRAAI
jgi:hypothetical protein